MTRNIRFTIDALMFMFLGTFFSKHIISMDYHVWGGLVFFMVTVWHVWLNRSWLTGLLQRKKCWQDGVNVLLIVAWLGMAVTGILAAKAFGIELHWMKPYHKFLGALSVILLAVHIGFHWVYLRESIRRRCQFLSRIPRLAGTVCLIATLCLGAYSFDDSGFTKYISAPFVTHQHMPVRPEGAERGKNKSPEFSVVNLGRLMAEVSAMVYLGAYVVRRISISKSLKSNPAGVKEGS